jgi:two-component system, response regulator PdtaR
LGEAMRALRILVVEDDALIGVLLSELLAEMGHEICAVETTEADAVAAAARCKPNLMIVDDRLGNESGISVVDEILCTGPIPHVFITGDPSRIRALRPGAVVVQKPFRKSDIVRAIQRVLGAEAASVLE